LFLITGKIGLFIYIRFFNYEIYFRCFLVCSIDDKEMNGSFYNEDLFKEAIEAYVFIFCCLFVLFFIINGYSYFLHKDLDKF
jgi:hypothetical protein